MKMQNAPYVFSACKQSCDCNPALSCDRANFLEGEKCNPYARLYVVSQAYENCASPEYALLNGTFFNDLYMPYVPSAPEC